MLLYDREEFERCPTGLLRPGLPLFYRRLAGIQVMGKDRLADTEALPKLLDLLGLEWWRTRHTRRVEIPQCGLINRSHSVERGRRGVYSLKCFAFELTFSRHCKSPSSRDLESTDLPAVP